MAFFTTQRKEVVIALSEPSRAAADARARYMTKKRKMVN